MVASKLKNDALAFLKEALMSKNHSGKDYKELHFLTCSSVLKVQPNHTALVQHDLGSTKYVARKYLPQLVHTIRNLWGEERRKTFKKGFLNENKNCMF